MSSEALAAAALIGLVAYTANPSRPSFLDSAASRFAGRVSYSYYLHHPLCLVATARVMLGALPLPLIQNYPLTFVALLWLGSSVLAFTTAHLSHTWVEKPWIAWAKQIGKRIQRPAAKPASSL